MFWPGLCDTLCFYCRKMGVSRSAIFLPDSSETDDDEAGLEEGVGIGKGFGVALLLLLSGVPADLLPGCLVAPAT